MAAQTEKERIAQLIKQVPTRGIERHPFPVKSIKELPAELQSPAVHQLPDQSAYNPLIVFPPQIHRGWNYIPKQALLFTPTDVAHLLASIWPGQEPQITHVYGSGLLYMEVKLILLYGFLEIVTQGPSTPIRLGMEFNTVAWHQLSRPLYRLLQATAAAPTTMEEKTRAGLDAYQALEKLPIKFSNGVRLYGLLPGESLEELVFQPGTWNRFLLLFRRPVTPNILLALTSNFMVVIREELQVSQGWIFSFIPRTSITGIQNRPANGDNELSILLKKDDQSVEYKLLLKSDTVQAWCSRWLELGGCWDEWKK